MPCCHVEWSKEHESISQSMHQLAARAIMQPASQRSGRNAARGACLPCAASSLWAKGAGAGQRGRRAGQAAKVEPGPNPLYAAVCCCRSGRAEAGRQARQAGSRRRNNHRPTHAASATAWLSRRTPCILPLHRDDSNTTTQIDDTATTPPLPNTAPPCPVSRSRSCLLSGCELRVIPPSNSPCRACSLA